MSTRASLAAAKSAFIAAVHAASPTAVIAAHPQLLEDLPGPTTAGLAKGDKATKRTRFPDGIQRQVTPDPTLDELTWTIA